MNRFSRTLAGAAAITLGAAANTAHADFSFAYAFGNPPEMVYNGSAWFNPGWNNIQLTTADDQTGSMWHADKQSIQNGFVTTFDFSIYQAGSTNVIGDGFAFVIQDSPAGTAAIGGGGSDLGYAGITRSIAIEFDTFDFGGEFGTPHVSIQSLGSNPNSSSDDDSLANATLSNFNVDILDGREHSVTIQYTPPATSNGILSVYIDGTLVCSTEIDLGNVEGLGSVYDEFGNSYVGFTAGTGLADSVHNFFGWGFVSDTTECIPPYWFYGWNGGSGYGGVFSMSVQTLGTFPTTFTWYKDGDEITDDDGGRIMGLGTNFLQIWNVTEADNGSYMMRFSNDCGSGDTFTADLNVSPPGCTVTCDYNQDGGGDTTDIIELADAIASGTDPYPSSCQDYNQDGGADTSDVIDMADAIASGTCP